MGTPSLIIGIAGGTGSGKTTIAHTLFHALGGDSVILDHDAYYRDLSHLSPEDRAKVNYDHPDALETELLLRHIELLRSGEAIQKPIYDFPTHTRKKESIRVEPAAAVIVEGILVLGSEALRKAMDVRIFVDTDPDIRLMRRIRRDIEERGRSFESVRRQYYSTVRPMHIEFVEPSKRHADLIIPEGGDNQIAIDLLVGHIRHSARRF